VREDFASYVRQRFGDLVGVEGGTLDRSDEVAAKHEPQHPLPAHSNVMLSSDPLTSAEQDLLRVVGALGPAGLGDEAGARLPVSLWRILDA
jgi:hypothetical protein